MKTCFFYTFSELIFFSCQLLTVAELPGTPWLGLREPGRASSSPASPKKLQGTHNDCRATTTNLVFPIKDRHRYFWKCSLSWWIGWSVGHYFLKGGKFYLHVKLSFYLALIGNGTNRMLIKYFSKNLNILRPLLRPR